MQRRGPWTVLGSAVHYENPWIQVVEHKVLNHRGNPGIYGTVHFKKLATGVVPIDAEGCTYLVGQHRFVFDHESWEIPEGGGDPAESPVVAARRELLEETGFTAGGWQEILRLELSNSVSNEVGVSFLAWNLVPGPPQPDDNELLAVRRVPFREALEMAWTGEIRDAIAVASLLKVELMARRGELPPAVASAIGAG